jgi:hypothetical protein
MTSPRLSVRIPQPLLYQFESYLDQNGLTVTEGVVAAIASYVGDGEKIPLVERMSRVEKRLAVLEERSLIPTTKSS